MLCPDDSIQHCDEGSDFLQRDRRDTKTCQNLAPKWFTMPFPPLRLPSTPFDDLTSRQLLSSDLGPCW